MQIIHYVFQSRLQEGSPARGQGQGCLCNSSPGDRSALTPPRLAGGGGSFLAPVEAGGSLLPPTEAVWLPVSCCGFHLLPQK